MSRITIIRDVAASSKGNLSDALLQCLVLADELNYEPLSDWANLEIGGYTEQALLPDYRKVRSALRGTLFEGYHYTTNYTIPEAFIEEELRKMVQTVYIFDGVGKLITLPDDGTLQQTVSGVDGVEGLINFRLQQESGSPFVRVRSVSLPISPGSFAGVLGAVQHKIVQFMIQLNHMFPSDDQLEESSGEKLGRVDEAFKNIISIDRADNVVFANSIATVDQSTTMMVNVYPDDFESLANYLQSLDVSNQAVSELEPIVTEIASGSRSEDVERSLKDWVGGRVSELPETAGDIAADSAKRALTDSIVQGIKKFAPKAAEWLSSIDFPIDAWPM